MRNDGRHSQASFATVNVVPFQCVQSAMQNTFATDDRPDLSLEYQTISNGSTRQQRLRQTMGGSLSRRSTSFVGRRSNTVWSSSKDHLSRTISTYSCETRSTGTEQASSSAIRHEDAKCTNRCEFAFANASCRDSCTEYAFVRYTCPTHHRQS